MGTNTEELTTTPADIERTRGNLTRDIDELTDKVSPSRVVARRKEATANRLGSLRDKVMGATPNPAEHASRAGDAISGSASGAVDTVTSKTQGSPLAAGVVAFGAGILISALLPSSDAESRAASRVVDAAKEHSGPVVDEAKSAGQEVAGNLKQSATESAQDLADSAKESAQTVKDEGQSSAQNVKETATSD
jgi:ElaB/YqjD/DUF883 family membrane-anchored ribosome-binding protein/vacuolar-type H+-ATPase subunit H